MQLQLTRLRKTTYRKRHVEMKKPVILTGSAVFITTNTTLKPTFLEISPILHEHVCMNVCARLYKTGCGH
jgi:hypothetical protein